MVYIVNNVPVFAVAIIEYEVNSKTRETRAVLRSKRGEEVSFVRVVASAFGRVEECPSVVSVV